MAIRPGSSTRQRVIIIDDGRRSSRRDTLATEEPLEIRLVAGQQRRTLAITMRTPGADFELAAGFLYGEGVVAGREAIRRITYCVDGGAEDAQRYNIVNVELEGQALPEIGPLERHFYTSSACGVCGKASLDALSLRGCQPVAHGPQVSPELIYGLPERLRDHQQLFASTGGIHAAGLFDAEGRLLAAREDVGRHNAVDKLIGWALMEGLLPLSRQIMLVSGRASYEIVQKAMAAGLPILCAVSAPSNLAVDVARSFGMTLVGFLRGRRFNIYTGAERVAY
jgi:FdhD protein